MISPLITSSSFTFSRFRRPSGLWLDPVLRRSGLFDLFFAGLADRPRGFSFCSGAPATLAVEPVVFGAGLAPSFMILSADTACVAAPKSAWQRRWVESAGRASAAVREGNAARAYLVACNLHSLLLHQPCHREPRISASAYTAKQHSLCSQILSRTLFFLHVHGGSVGKRNLSLQKVSWHLPLALCPWSLCLRRLCSQPVVLARGQPGVEALACRGCLVQAESRSDA